MFVPTGSLLSNPGWDWGGREGPLFRSSQGRAEVFQRSVATTCWLFQRAQALGGVWPPPPQLFVLPCLSPVAYLPRLFKAPLLKD